jgi:glycine/D-amino acid oxidase-like deaminating enzyme
LHEIDTVIVGGGQAGLAISYYLTQEGREHVALERTPAVANACLSGGTRSSERTFSPSSQSCSRLCGKYD